MNNRLEFLDSLRGIAILLVVGYHAFARWPEVVPYGNQYGSIEIFRQGLLGVQLFFLISGFVILMSLGASKGPVVFLFKRWSRLFPVMMIATVVVYATSGFFHERPWGQPQLLDVLPGLTFVEPTWWSAVMGQQIRDVEGAFWSLYVEFKFYFIAAALYFVLGREKLVFALASMFVFAVAVQQMGAYMTHPLINIAGKVSNNLSFQYFGWFASGAAFFIFYKTQERSWVYLAIALAIASSLNSKYPVGALLVSSVFIAAITSERVQQLLVSRFLMFFGFVSYPLYLLHENMMISLIVKLGEAFPEVPGYFLPVVPLAAIVAMSYLITRYMDSQIKNGLLKTGFKAADAVKALRKSGGEKAVVS
jgi:peptidoglycan/LPS O-acetylase OafA/YrhL